MQTSLAHAVTNYYSRKFHVKIRVGKVDFEFFKKLVLRNVYIQDLHADTLLYAGDLKLDIGQISFKKHQLYINNIGIDNAKVHLTTYKNENHLNLQFLVDAFSSPDTSKKAGPTWNIEFGGLTLNGIDFRLQNQHYDTTSSYGVNTANLRIHRIYASIKAIRFSDDTVRATIENFSAREQSGFTLKDFTCFVKLTSHGMELDAMKLQTASSDIYTDLILKYKRFSDFNDFTNKVEMNAKFNRSKVCFDDVSYFAHGLKAVHTCISLSGDYKGTVNHLTAHNMSIGWGNFSVVEGDATLDNITDIDSAFIKVNITNLITSKKEIESLPIPPFDKEEHIHLPANMDKLKAIHIRGFFDGTLNSFKAGGIMFTDIGTISANLNMNQKPGSSEPVYSGRLETSNFNLGDFWDIKGLGDVTTSVSLSGKGLTREKADGTLSGVIQSLTFRNYTYQNTKVSGELKKGFFSGMLKVTDPHLILDFEGKVSLASQNSVFQFESHITKANLTALHIIKDTGVHSLSGDIRVNATGNNLDNLAGSLHLDTITYTVKKRVYHLNHLALTSTMQGDYRKINLTSDYADGSLSGHFHLANTVENFKTLMASYLPLVFPKEKYREIKGQHDYSLALHFNNDTGLTDLLVPGLKIAQGTQIEGHYNEHSRGLDITGSSKEIDISAKKIKNWRMDITGDGISMILKTRCDTLFLSDSLYAAAFRLKSDIAKDTAHYTISWNDDSANFGNIPGYVAFSNQSKMTFQFSHPVISMIDTIWKINNGNLITYDSSRWVIKSFVISHNTESFVALQGAMGSSPDDKLDMSIHNINLGSLKFGGTPLEGEVNGRISISSLFHQPFFTSALGFSEVMLNGKYIGDGNINSSWDTASQSVKVDGNLSYHGEPALSVRGTYTPASLANNLSLDMALSAFPSSLLQPNISDVCSILDGTLKGQVHITGTPDKPLIYGDVTENLKQIKFDYLNTSYHSPGIHVKIMPDTFQILSSVLLDEKNDTAYYSGLLTHRNFKSLQMDFYGNAKKFLCLNTTESQNSSYFGQAYVTGKMRIHGLLKSLHIDADITTEKNTVFNIPLTNPSELEEVDWIQFKSKGKNAPASAYKVKLNGISMDFTIHVTSVAATNVLFSTPGEMLHSEGYGTILFSMDNIGVINMHGNYTIDGGYYVFVLPKLSNKQFILRPGGTIQWNGDPYNADIDLTAYYPTSASLEPFFPNDPVYNKRFPVYCDLNLSGKLTLPDVAFKIELPTADNPTRQIVESYLSNEDELKEQVFALMMVNSFMPPTGAGIANTSGTQFGFATSTEMLSNQFSNWLNKTINGVNVLVDYQPASTLNPTEAKVAVTKALLNGKVIVNTDVGTMGALPSSTQSSAANTNFVGEIDIESPISKNGKLRVKAYNKANDNTTDPNTLNAPYTQGAGISYKEGFNTWAEFWGKLFSKKQKVAGDTATHQ